MGQYLSEPRTDVISGSETISERKISYGYSSMQGWRTTMEDAHICLPKFDEGSSLFAVFDGHGGLEVARYCQIYLPSMLKELDAYKSNDITSALKTLFMKIDADLTKEEVIDELKKISQDDVETEDEGLEELNALQEEGQMPIEELLKRYGKSNKNLVKVDGGDSVNNQNVKTDTQSEASSSGVMVIKEKAPDEDIGENLNGDAHPDSSEDEDIDSDDDDDDEDDGEEVDNDDDDDEDDGADDETVDASTNPGQDSGTTAVVALIKDKTLYVANAGDSRCVLCRSGHAVDMSDDHKPDDPLELARIQAAGGILQDGRVNGGLNLSRAIGDHFYKSNECISLENQMISAMPDVKTMKFTDDDDFIIIACDGIWNMMSSEAVVEFIKHRINEKSLPTICEELMHNCLAPDTTGDGSGCDNMTVIIITLKPHPLTKEIKSDADDVSRKRTGSPSESGSSSAKKRTRTDLSEGCSSTS